MLNERVLGEGYARLMPIPPNLKFRNRLAHAFRLAAEQRWGFWGDE
jgi:endonuclease YncB( thermonuclease family)